MRHISCDRKHLTTSESAASAFSAAIALCSEEINLQLGHRNGEKCLGNLNKNTHQCLKMNTSKGKMKKTQKRKPSSEAKRRAKNFPRRRGTKINAKAINKSKYVYLQTWRSSCHRRLSPGILKLQNIEITTNKLSEKQMSHRKSSNLTSMRTQKQSTDESPKSKQKTTR